ncbi:MAG TPA: hypothetical protein VE595_04375 [Nitrososphaeraceae archaeon]|nr:hypothetical protein [Nitrososphaeraceae archaeon]
MLQLYFGLPDVIVEPRTSIYLFYQQSGDAKKPYFAQYSAVCEDAPVRVMN